MNAMVVNWDVADPALNGTTRLTNIIVREWSIPRP